MKKISNCVILFVAIAMLAVACEKTEDPIVPESKLVGVWQAPLVANGGMMDDFRGKNLIINENHTATFSVLSFNNWKIEGNVLTLANYYSEGTNRHIEVLRYTIEKYADTAMLLAGTYTYVVGDSVYLEEDMSGLFKRQKNTSAQQ